MRTRALAGAALFGVSLAAQAHYLWIERDGPGASVWFGEWARDLRENESGPLKAIQGLQAFDAQRRPLAVERRPDHFLIPRVGSGDIRAFDEVMHRGSKVIYEVKYGRSETKGVMNFELVPEAPGGNRLVLMLEGKPLPEAELTVFGPPKWEKTFKTDAQGRVGIETPWKGFYVVRAQYDDDTAGEFEGKKFDKIINVTILSFEVSDGTAWPPH